MRKIKLALLLSSVLVSSVLSAQTFAKQSAIKITSEVHELIQVVDAEGNAQQKVIAADEIVPGDRILFTTSFQNNGAEASDNVVITNPIPKHTRYLAGTAQGEHCLITYSVDGGRAWGDAKSLKVRMKDGKYRAATAADYTHIRWKYSKSLQPSESKSITFETTLL